MFYTRSIQNYKNNQLLFDRILFDQIINKNGDPHVSRTNPSRNWKSKYILL